MRAILTNFGSTGSVYPFLALARELRAHGHEAVVALSPPFRPWVEHYELEFAAVGPDLRQIQEHINHAMLDLPDSAEVIGDLFAPLLPAWPQLFRDLWDVCRDADVLISGPWQPASLMIHELTALPLVTIQNSHFGGGGTPAFQRASASLINPLRARYGLPPVDHPLTRDANSPQLVLYNMSRTVRPPAPDWPAHYHMPGYLFLDDENWQPEPAMAEFMAGEPPAVVSFGSMTHGDPAALTKLLLRAIEMVGCRAVIQQGWTGLAKDTMPSYVHAAGFVPHDWLFRRACCSVHHGGAGTAASAFRSGVPSVFVPHSFDHPLWAALAVDAGCSPPPIPYADLTAERLATAITAARQEPTYKRKAAELAVRLNCERGLSRARVLVEDLVARVRQGPGGSAHREAYAASALVRRTR